MNTRLDTPSQPASSEDVRKRWTAPRLEAHESLTVLTQNVMGAIGPVLFAMQGISGGPGGTGGPNAARTSAQGASPSPGGSSPHP